jgi:hypothetical protein
MTAPGKRRAAAIGLDRKLLLIMIVPSAIADVPVRRVQW